MVAAWEDLVPSNWDLVLLDRYGCYVQTLFPVNQYDWRLVWDRDDPEILYTWHGKTLYRFNVTTGMATPVKTFSAPLLAPGPSINQDNTKMLVLTGEPIPVLRVLRMSDWTEVASFSITKDGKTFKGTTDCQTGWKDERFIGYQDHIYVACRGKPRGPGWSGSSMATARSTTSSVGRSTATIQTSRRMAGGPTSSLATACASTS